MAVISAPDLVLLRTTVNKVTPYLSVLQPSILLSALVDGLHTRGARTIAYNTGSSSSFATIEAGQTVWFYTTDGIVRSRIKSITGTAASGSFVIDENGIGPLPDNTVIEIYHTYDIQPIPPVIRSQVFYKFFDETYVLQNEEPPPVAIIGSHLAGFLSAGSIVFQLNSSSSYAIADGATISSRVWSCAHMGGGTTGITISNTTTANPTLTLTIAGQYWLKCVVTDSNGKTQATYRAIFVYDSSNLPYKDFSIQSLTGDWASGGWRATIVPFGDVTLDEFPDRTLCLLWYVGKFGSTEDYVDLWDINANNVILGGYIRQDNDTDQFVDGTGNVSFDVTTPESVIDNISELGSVSLNAVSNPDVWYEYASWMTTGRAVHHLIKYHSYGVLQVWDVLGLDEDSRGVLNTDFTESSLLQQINGLAFNRGIYAKMACDRFGRLHLVKDSNILNDAGRAALDTVMTILEADVSGVVTLIRNPEEQIAFGELNGFSFNGSVSTPFISILPGYRESSVSYIMPNLRGSGTLSVGNQILSSQTDSNERIGRVLAQANNNPRELRHTTPYNGLGAFDIINSIGWYEWGMADADLKRNTELNGRNLICRSITHAFNHLAGTVQTELSFEPEAFGPDGIQGNYPTSYPVTIPPEPNWTPPTPGGNSDFGEIWNNEAGGTDGLTVFGNVGSINLASDYIYEAVQIKEVANCGLTTSKALIVFKQTSSSDTYARILNIDSNQDVSSAGSSTLVNATNRINHTVISLSSTSALLVYDDGSSVYGVILSVSGDVITVGTEYTIGSVPSGTEVSGVARLSATKAIVTFPQGSSAPVQAAILDISGDVITANTQNDATTGNGGNLADVVGVDSSTAIILYRKSSDVTARASLLTSITTGFTITDDIEVSVNGIDQSTWSPKWFVMIDTNKAIGVWTYDTGATFNIVGAIIETDGSTLTAGSVATIATSGGTLWRRTPSVAKISSSLAIVSYFNQYGAGAGEIKGSMQTVTISGDSLTANADEVDFSAQIDTTQGNHYHCICTMESPS